MFISNVVNILKLNHELKYISLKQGYTHFIEGDKIIKSRTFDNLQ